MVYTTLPFTNSLFDIQSTDHTPPWIRPAAPLVCSCHGRRPWANSRSMQEIEPKDLTIRPFQLLDDEWALLVSGTRKPNPMTVSWGGLGTLWGRPTVTVYVRPTRHTYSCLEESREFTLNFVPPSMRDALRICGEASGRDRNKWQLAGIAPAPSARVRVPRVSDARMVFECRVMACMDVDPAKFLDPTIENQYSANDYHRVYLGEVMGLFGDERGATGA
jgi:flavin reductase (DIM6/NTAB) family NADH-FMN oxidoreductase RutF